MPRGILFTLGACALLYAGVALVLTGIAHWDTLNNDAPVANALKALGYNRIRFVVTVGALLGMTSSLLVGQYGQARIWFAMSRDRLLPPLFSRVHPRYETPHLSTWVAGFAVGIPAGIWDIGTFGDLTNIGTLFAFIVVSAGVIILRRTNPDRPRSFRVPWVPLLPGHLDRVLPGADAEPAARDLDPLRRLAGDRPGDLFLLRAEADAGVREAAGRFPWYPAHQEHHRGAKREFVNDTLSERRS